MVVPPDAAPLTERFGTLNLPLGGKHGYKGVRGSQGPKRDQFQGTTPRKTHFTKNFAMAHEAAVALALLKKDLETGEDEDDVKKPRKSRKQIVRAACHACVPHACGMILTHDSTRVLCRPSRQAAQPPRVLLTCQRPRSRRV